MTRKQIMKALDDNVTRLECEVRDAERRDMPTRCIERLRIRLGEARRIRNRIRKHNRLNSTSRLF